MLRGRRVKSAARGSGPPIARPRFSFIYEHLADRDLLSRVGLERMLGRLLPAVIAEPKRRPEKGSRSTLLDVEDGCAADGRPADPAVLARA